MEVHISGTETEWHPKKGNYLGFDEQKLKEIIAKGELDFDGWTKIISEVENFFHDEIENICLVYDSFLSEFPLCYGYWRRYADHMMRLCTIDKAVDVFERAVQSATYSIDVWVDYCGFSVSVFEDDNDIRRLFKRAMSYVGKDYLCHTLWDKYVEFEFSREQWSSLANVYIQTLRFPSKKLHHYYESFQKLAATWKEEMQCPNDMDLLSDPRVENEVSSCHTDAEIACIIKDLLDASTGLDGTKALAKYLSIGKQFYREASELDEKIHHFEAGIRRPYFHVKELDISQLENWHEYLNFVEMHGDFDWAVKLYERCLIPCANYPEFWMRYVDFMESKGGREIANFALARAAKVFLKRMPVIHLFTARFKEKIRDVSGAHIALLHYEKESDLSFVETGNFVAASNTYKEAMEIAAVKQKFDILPILYINFSRLQYMITSNSDAARDILIDGIKCLPHCKLLLEELIKFGMMHGGPRDIHVLDAIINDVISLRVSQGMDAKEAEEISSLYLQFVDLCGTIDDIRKAWNRHIKCFPESARGSTYKFSVINGIKSLPLKITASRRQESLDPLPSHSSGDRSLDIPVQSPSRDNILKPSENDDAQSNHAALDCVPDTISKFLEDHEIPLYQATVNKLQSGEVDESLQGGRQHSSEEVSNKLQSGEDIKTTTNMSSHNLIQDEMRNGVEALETSKENSKENKFRQEHEHKPEHDVNELPLERLSLGQLDRESLDSISFANQEGETFVETSLSNESMVKKEPPQETSKLNGIMPECAQSNDGYNLESSPRSAQASDSAGIQTEMSSPSSLASQQNIKKTEPLVRRTPPDDGGSWHQRSNADRVHRENKFGHRRHSHKRQHQRQQMSPKRQHSRSETGTQVPMSQGYPSQSMYSQSPQVQQGGQSQSRYSTSAAHPNLAAVHNWSMQDVHQQNFAPTQTPPVPLPGYPQTQISQNPMQSNEQLGQMQTNQAYNHMWQYYYYQQQQQQFLLQQQQQPLPQQQLLQQQYQQHPQLLQVQQQYLQQQQLPYQQPQLLQQQQFIQQQQYLQQQQQLQPQGSYQQQFPPPNPHPYLQQQQEQEKRQHGQITASQVQTQSELSKEESMMEPRGQTTLQVQDPLPCRNDASETVLSTISPNSQQG
ncbi:nuclear factor of activated T-cells 5 isoform X2 [Gossypium australe]|uniref:Nuclear factor of activated T-cells 5 isoform X2 n=1 Tax=Gossypium australe TaxID=47621 RepID=A0A5B6XA37_9ROSI|nr:nuclear factor of activated T-cells 5 isoform X2 [Gossypium australe]